MLLYADDIVLYLTGTSFEDIFKNMQMDLNLIHQWSIFNKLTLSVSKTKSLLCGRKSKLSTVYNPPKFSIGNDLVEWTDCFCYLGISIDNILSFNAAIDQMHRKAAYRLKMFYSIRSNLPIFSAITLVKAVILPYLDYGCFLLSVCTDAQIRRLQTVQNQSLKLALKLDRCYNSRLLHTQSNTLLLKDRILFQQLFLIHRSIAYNMDLFPLKQTLSSVSTRSTDSSLLSSTHPHLELFRKSFCYLGVQKYNELPDNIKEASSFSSFKNLLKKHLLENFSVKS